MALIQDIKDPGVYRKTVDNKPFYRKFDGKNWFWGHPELELALRSDSTIYPKESPPLSWEWHCTLDGETGRIREQTQLDLF